MELCDPASDPVCLELLKAGLGATVALLTLSLGWLIGNRLTALWALRQKERELELASMNKLYELYGEFFSIWKLWNSLGETMPQDQESKEVAAAYWKLLERASKAEAGVEAILFKMASERKINKEDISYLGRFRQAYQRIREAIEDKVRLGWTSSSPRSHSEYATFKHLACHVASMLYFPHKHSLIRLRENQPPSPDEASKALLRITSNQWEDGYWGWVYEREVDLLAREYEEWVALGNGGQRGA